MARTTMHFLEMGPWVTSAKLARTVGARTYFTGKACSNGHTAPRTASESKCIVCRKDRWERVRRRLGHSPFRPNSEKRAAAELAEKYFHGAPCPHGHDGKRWTHNSACVECTKEAAREFHKTDEGLAYAKRWRVANLDKVRESNRNMKARRKGADGKHTADDIREILNRQHYKCAECGDSVRNQNNRHVDHIMPIALGGSNWPSNLQVLCPPCNLSKSAKHPLDFARSRGRLL